MVVKVAPVLGRIGGYALSLVFFVEVSLRLFGRTTVLNLSWDFSAYF